MSINFRINKFTIYQLEVLGTQVPQTISRYSKQGSCCRKFWNFIKSIIGQSDWQKTVRAVKKELRAEIKYQLLKQTENRETEQFKETMKKVDKHIISKQDSVTEAYMNVSLKLANGKKLSSKEEKKFDDLGLTVGRRFLNAGIILV